jgi:hypothetical protein
MKTPISKSQYKRVQTQKEATIIPRTSSSLSRSNGSDVDINMQGFTETVSNILNSDNNSSDSSCESND